MDLPLSDHDIRELLNIDELKHSKIKHVNIVEMNDIGKYKSVDQLFNNQGHVIFFIRYPAQSVGHWVSAVRHGNEIYFFDSLGKPLEHYDEKNHLKKIAKGYKIRSNKIKFQSDRSNCCGKYSIFIIFLNKMNLSNTEIDLLLKLIKKKYKSIDKFLIESFAE
jgi:hypothetical protein